MTSAAPTRSPHRPSWRPLVGALLLLLAVADWGVLNFAVAPRYFAAQTPPTQSPPQPASQAPLATSTAPTAATNVPRAALSADLTPPPSSASAASLPSPPASAEASRPPSLAAAAEPKADSIYFETGTSRLSDRTKKTLMVVGYRLRQNPELRVVLAGHTDDRGYQEWNDWLGKRRADVAKIFLVELGISSDRIIVEGHAGERPAAANDTAEGRALNRRVDIAWQ